MNQSVATDYFSEIEDAFVRCRGQSLFVSSKDWQIIDDWQKKGIPQHIAINAIEDVFRDRSPSARKVSTLAFCSQAVEERFAEWAAGQVGSSEEVFADVALEACSVCGKEICFSLHRD